MSSLFSDPPFARGTTLLAGETIEYNLPGVSYSATNDSGKQYPVAGREIVGQVKVFQDINPNTKARLSSELVYCIAARYKPTSTTNLTSPAGKGVVLKIGQYLESASFDQTLASQANVNTGERVGFLDEYLSSSTIIRPDDIVWVTFKGPASLLKTAVAIDAGAVVSMSATAGSVMAKTVDSIWTAATNEPSLVGLGLCWGDVSNDLATVDFGVNAGAADTFARVNLWGQNWA